MLPYPENPILTYYKFCRKQSGNFNSNIAHMISYKASHKNWKYSEILGFKL